MRRVESRTREAGYVCLVEVSAAAVGGFTITKVGLKPGLSETDNVIRAGARPVEQFACCPSPGGQWPGRAGFPGKADALTSAAAAPSLERLWLPSGDFESDSTEDARWWLHPEASDDWPEFVCKPMTPAAITASTASAANHADKGERMSRSPAPDIVFPPPDPRSESPAVAQTPLSSIQCR